MVLFHAVLSSYFLSRGKYAAVRQQRIKGHLLEWMDLKLRSITHIFKICKP